MDDTHRLEEKALREAMVAGAQGHLELPEKALDGFAQYYRMMVDFNHHTNLTRITQPEEVAERHFLDSLSPLLVPGLLPQGARVIDVGSGAGFPGVPLLLMRQDLDMTLLDSSKKRVDFLSQLCQSLGLSAHVLHARAEQSAHEGAHRAAYDVALSRAVARLSVLAEYLAPFLRVGGRALCLKGAAYEQEILEADFALKTLGVCVEKTHHLPFGGDDHHIIVLQKTRSTPPMYPRRAGLPERAPLCAGEPAGKPKHSRENKGR